MSLKTFLLTAATDAFDAIKSEVSKIEGVVETIFVSETQTLAAKVKESDLGTRALNLFEEIVAKGETVEEKGETVLATVIDDLKALDASGGLTGLAVSVENFGAEIFASLKNDFLSAAAKL